MLNAKASWVKNNIQVDIWGKNLTNTQYNAFIFEVGPAAYAQSGKPLQAGVSLTFKMP